MQISKSLSNGCVFRITISNLAQPLDRQPVDGALNLPVIRKQEF